MDEFFGRRQAYASVGNRCLERLHPLVLQLHVTEILGHVSKKMRILRLQRHRLDPKDCSQTRQLIFPLQSVDVWEQRQGRMELFQPPHVPPGTQSLRVWSSRRNHSHLQKPRRALPDVVLLVAVLCPNFFGRLFPPALLGSGFKGHSSRFVHNPSTQHLLAHFPSLSFLLPVLAHGLHRICNATFKLHSSLTFKVTTHTAS